MTASSQIATPVTGGPRTQPGAGRERLRRLAAVWRWARGVERAYRRLGAPGVPGAELWPVEPARSSHSPVQ